MDFELSEERRMMAETIRRYIADNWPTVPPHPGAPKQEHEAYDRKVNEVRGGLAELGLIGALLPAEAGGFGGTGEDIAVVFEELGRGCVTLDFLSTGVLAATPLFLSLDPNDGARADMAEAVIAGNRVLAFAHAEPDSRYALSQVGLRAEPAANGSDEGWRLTGTKSLVFNAGRGSICVSARTSGEVDSEDGLVLVLVDAAASGIETRQYGTIDGLDAADVTFNEVFVSAANVIGEPGQAYPLIETGIARGVVALCAEAVGLMARMQEITLDYLKTRTQFGRPIGKFQVLQHRFVDMALEIEQARSATMLAASLVDGADRIARERTVSAAKNLIGRVGRLVAEECVQMHGGIAMTWEYELAHYAKRLVMIDHQFGDEDFHLQRFIEMSRRSAT